MSLLYHGTSAPLFGRFSLEHVLQGDGKCKFGWGVLTANERGRFPPNPFGRANTRGRFSPNSFGSNVRPVVQAAGLW